MKELGWIQTQQFQAPTAKIPLQFNFPPVEIITKQLTKLNSTHPQRICYLGPRWQNSVIFHKKYSTKQGSYAFRESKQTRCSNFINDSMSNNQFYRNQFYYRAFEGMNPTINIEEELIFQSRFQCGNLDCAIKINQNEYDLFLRIDSNTRGNIFWYYFSIRNTHQRKKVKLNICNLTKTGTHYSKGLNPFVFSNRTQKWTQNGFSNVTFQQKRLKYEFLYERMKVDTFYELSFQFQIEEEEEMELAYCIPYSYSQLLQDLNKIKDKAEVGVLGQTLTGINIPIIMIGKNDQNWKKKVVMITGRVHPGETNSSIILSNIIKSLCFDESLQILRQKQTIIKWSIIFLIVPMINPDGVIIGNSRSGAAGLDLNRQFKTKNKSLFPQITLLKNLVNRINETHELELYFDFHGHSKKKNMFIYGPPYHVTQPQYYKCRVFPKILSNLTSLFRYYSCQFDIPYQKRATARSVMLNQLMIPFVYTVQASLGFYYDYVNHKTEPFTRDKWEQLGQVIVNALKEYYEGVFQYQDYLESKRLSRKNLIQDLKSISINKEKKTSKDAGGGVGLKQIKLLKLYEEIRLCEEKKGKDEKKEKEEEEDSDSHDEGQNLQKQKLYEFGRMVTQFMEQEQTRQRNYYSQKPKTISRKDIVDLSPDSKKKNIQMLRKRQKKWRQQQQIINQEMNAIKGDKKKKDDIQAKKKHRRSQLSQEQNHYLNVQRAQLSSQQLQRGLSLNNQKQRFIQRAKLIPSQQYIQQNLDLSTGEKRMSTKMNIRMFNFEKTINHKSIRYSQGKDISKIKELNIHKNKNLSELKKRFDQKRNLEEHLKKESPQNKSNFIQLDYIEEDGDITSRKQEEQASLGKSQKNKYVFPSSFYRIKYQNHKKKQQIKKNKIKIDDGGPKSPERQMATIGLLQANISYLERKEEGNKKQGLFVKINRFPLL